MAKTIKLFVGGLPPTVTKEELEHVFCEFGPSLKIDLQLKEGSSLNQGYAFLLVTDPSIADRIVESEFEVRHRRLQVQFSKKIPKKQNVAPLRLYCRGIPPEVSDHELTRFFNEFADCRAAYCIKNSHGKKKGYGFIELFEKESAQALLDIKTFKLRDTHLVVEEFSRLIRTKPPAIPDNTSGNPRVSEKRGELYEVLKSESQSKNQAQNFEMEHNPNCVYSQNDINHNSSISSGAEIWKGSVENIKPRIKETNKNKNEQNVLSKKVHGWVASSVGTQVNNGLSSKYWEDSLALHKISWINIGDSTWMQRHRVAGMLESARYQHHGSANMRFNILKKSPSETTPQ